MIANHSFRTTDSMYAVICWALQKDSEFTGIINYFLQQLDENGFQHKV